MNSLAVDQTQKAVKYLSWLNSKSWLKYKLEKKSAFLLLLGVSVIFLLHCHSSHPFNSFFRSNISIHQEPKKGNGNDLEKMLKGAATTDKTIILTTSNKARAEPGSILDIFLGNNTNRLLQHLVIISLDENAHHRCLAVHPHCYSLKPKTGDNFTGEAFFMTPKYLEIVWTKIHLMSTVLQLGYNFVFTDADIMWLRDPFPHFDKDADVQIACDVYNGNPNDTTNKPSSGFIYVRSNERSTTFYKYWYSSRLKFPEKHDQDVLNIIKIDPFMDEVGLKMKFLDTKYFSGFCQQSKDFNRVCTMHARCCVGLKRKVEDLKIINEDWRRFMLASPHIKSLSTFTWRAPYYCWKREGNSSYMYT